VPGAERRLPPVHGGGEYLLPVVAACPGRG
jgi:hypothetical protein